MSGDRPLPLGPVNTKPKVKRISHKQKFSAVIEKITEHLALSDGLHGEVTSMPKSPNAADLLRALDTMQAREARLHELAAGKRKPTRSYVEIKEYTAELSRQLQVMLPSIGYEVQYERKLSTGHQRHGFADQVNFLIETKLVTLEG